LKEAAGKATEKKQKSKKLGPNSRIESFEVLLDRTGAGVFAEKPTVDMAFTARPVPAEESSERKKPKGGAVQNRRGAEQTDGGLGNIREESVTPDSSIRGFEGRKRIRGRQFDQT